MIKKKQQILLTYSSGYGATKEVGEKIAHIIEKTKPFNVVLKSIDQAHSIKDYSAIIVGTSVRADTILANTRDFFQRHKKLLCQKKVAFFVVCLTASSEEGKKKVMAEYLPQITEKFPNINLVSVNAFGGKIDYSKMNPVMESLVRRVVEEKTGASSNGSFDNRNWEQINDWAYELSQLLT
jgi:menaquinone-dependent protoporphyrinogen oxidase